MSLEKLHGKVKYSLFLLAVSINILIRYPRVPYELGVDSFFIHAMAESLNINGRGPWLLNPISYFGYYPFSYPSGTPFLISAFSQVSGLSIELSIMILSVLLGVLGFFTAYQLASVFFKNDSVKMIVGFVYSTAPIFIKYTYWTASARGLLLAFMPLILWLILVNHQNTNITPNPKIRKFYQIKIIALAIIFVIISFTIHYSAWILLAFIIVFILITSIIRLITKTASRRSNARRRLHVFTDIRILKNFLVIILIFIFIMLTMTIYNIINHGDGNYLGYFNEFSSNIGTYFLWSILTVAVMIICILLTRSEKSEEFSETTELLISAGLIMIAIVAFLQPFSSSLNKSVMGWMNTEGLGQVTGSDNSFRPIDYIETLATIVIGRYGLLIFFAGLGMIQIFFFERRFIQVSIKNWKTWFLLCSMTLTLPFLSMAPYPLEFFTIMMSLFAGYGAYVYLKVPSKRILRPFPRIITITLIISILVFSSFTIAYRTNNRYDITGDYNFIDHELMELSIFVDNTIGNKSFQDPDSIQTTRISALTGKESRYYHSHDFQYLIWRDVEFKKLKIKMDNLSDYSFNGFIEIFYRPYEVQSLFTLPPREYYILPEYDEIDLNVTGEPELRTRYYCVYGNDRASVWLLNEDFGRVVGYN